MSSLGSGSIPLPFGLEAPAITDVAFGAAGLMLPNIITNKVMSYAATAAPSLAANQAVSWMVRVASVLVPGMLIRKYVGPRAGYAYMIGGMGNLVISALNTFAPTLLPSIGLGYQPLLGYYPGGQIVGRGMGAYTDRQIPARRGPSQSLPPIMSGVPERLNPANRF